ncbi:MAG: hypothetical protein IPL99_08825 [Candidatus Competibacteraceae bacterium]|nr:hypothetical protein [Candidatus Competibacteraceae bacterium]
MATSPAAGRKDFADSENEAAPPPEDVSALALVTTSHEATAHPLSRAFIEIFREA